MRILLVNDYGTPTGGAELQVLRLRAGLRARGHDVRLFTSTAGPRGAPVLADDACYGTMRNRAQVLVQTVNPSAAVRLRRVLSAFAPDVVHVRMFLTQLSPLVLPLLADVPSVYHVAFYRAICPRGTKLLPDGRRCEDPAGRACLRNGCLTPQSWLLDMTQLALLRRWRGVFDAVVGLSETVRRPLEAEGIGPVQVIPNGVPERPQRPALSGPPTVAFAGRLVVEKGADVLLRAFAAVVGQVPDAHLLLAGDGPERGRLGQLADRVPGHVTWLGHLPPAELERRCDAAWVQAVPGRWDEPFGNVATEAMMRGTAVVASDLGGPAEVVREGVTGLLVPPGDAAALAGALVRLLTDRGLAERLGAAGGPWRCMSTVSSASWTAASGCTRSSESMPDAAPAVPELSVVVVTPHRFAQLRRTVRHLRAQAIRERIELVLVAPDEHALADCEPADVEGFWAVTRLAAGPIANVDRASAQGVRAARAEVVAVVEDHAFVQPGWAEAIVAAHAQPVAAVGSVMLNANPRSALSWVNLLLAYGAWLDPRRAGPVDSVPAHNLTANARCWPATATRWRTSSGAAAHCWTTSGPTGTPSRWTCAPASRT